MSNLPPNTMGADMTGSPASRASGSLAPVRSGKAVRSILFVDDEEMVLELMQETLPRMREDWDMRFAKSGPEALAMLEQMPAKVVVTDYTMPEMDGLQFLDEVVKRYPDTIRIVLSGRVDSNSLVFSSGPSHNFLPKPCEPSLLFETIDRAYYLRRQVDNPELQSLISRTQALPSLPQHYADLFNEFNSREPSIDRIGRIVSHDVAMCAKILHVVNLAGIGLAQRITDPVEAAAYLGTNAIKSLVISTLIFSQFGQPAGSAAAHFVEDLWTHSNITAAFARIIARAQGTRATMVEECFAAGLLHDIGKLVFLTHLSPQFQEALRVAKAKDIQLWQAELEVLGTTHGEAGAYLLGLWNLSNATLAGVGSHHNPQEYWEKRFSVVTAVHAANAIAHLPSKAAGDTLGDRVDFRYLDNLGLSNRLEEWVALCKEAPGN